MLCRTTCFPEAASHCGCGLQWFRTLCMVLTVHHADWTCPSYPRFHSLQMGATMARIMRERGLA